MADLREPPLSPAAAQARAEMLRHLSQRQYRIPRKLVKHFIHSRRQTYRGAMYVNPRDSEVPPHMPARKGQKPYLPAGYRADWREALRNERVQALSEKRR